MQKMSVCVCASMDKLKLTGWNLGRVFSSRLGHSIVRKSKQPNLKLKTQPKQLLGYLLLAVVFPEVSNYFILHMTVIISSHLNLAKLFVYLKDTRDVH
jgi:hypothetical protein